MISVEQYNFKFFGDINRWLKAYGMPTLTWREIPKIGFVALYKDKAIASIFLREVEGGYGLVDGMIGDPEADRGKRNEALDALTSKLVEEAKKNSITKLMAFTYIPAVKNRAHRHNFKSKSAYLLNIEL